MDASLSQRGLHSYEEGTLQCVIWREVTRTAGLHCRSKHNRKKKSNYFTLLVQYGSVQLSPGEEMILNSSAG